MIGGVRRVERGKERGGEEERRHKEKERERERGGEREGRNCTEEEGGMWAHIVCLVSLAITLHWGSPVACTAIHLLSLHTVVTLK